MKTTTGSYFMPVRLSIKCLTLPSDGAMLNGWKFYALLVGGYIGSSTLEKKCHYLAKAKSCIPYVPGNPLLEQISHKYKGDM